MTRTWVVATGLVLATLSVGGCARGANPPLTAPASPSEANGATTAVSTTLPATSTTATEVVLPTEPTAPTAPIPTTSLRPSPRARAITPTTSASTTAPTPSEEVTIRYRVERRTTDDATLGFESVVEATLSDERGWRRARFVFERAAPSEEAPYLIVLAEGDEVDRLCLPYDTYGKYSCQNGPTVALNADRWRSSTPKWTGDLPDYRRMLVNHEVGHLLGMKHPRPQCPAPGRPAPVMNQQSTELNGCLPNPWPLDSEIAVAARHDRKLAPGPGE